MVNENFLGTKQYRDSSRLAARSHLHATYGRGDWFSFVASHAGFEADTKVLDIGCGAGWFWSEAAGQIPDGLGLWMADQSEGMVVEALKRVEGVKRWRGLAGESADICDLSFADGIFAHVLALHMLYHAEDPELAIDEIVRVLKPGGTAVISTNGQENMRRLYQFGHAAFGGPPGDPGAERFGIENARPMLEAAFESVTFFPYPDVLHCTDPDDVRAFLTSFPPGDKATPEQLSKLEGMLAEAMETGGGEIAIEKDVGVFVCRTAEA